MKTHAHSKAIAPPAGPSRVEVWRMFDRIAPRYDFLNRVLSMRQDVAWRNRVAGMLPEREGMRVLDLATGTADLLLTLVRRNSRVAGGVGVDMSGGMLRIGRRKIEERGLGARLSMLRGDAVRLSFADASFDAVTISFGIRNVLEPRAALSEMRRVLKPGGRALVLEFSLPANAILRSGYLFYFRNVLPRIGGAISGDVNAYKYLNRTVEAFPYGEAFCEWMRGAGFRSVTAQPVSFGIAAIYSGEV